MPVTIKRCDCVSNFQDKEYGPGLRCKNLCKFTSGKYLQSRCSVCGRVSDLGQMVKKEEVKSAKKKRK